VKQFANLKTAHKLAFSFGICLLLTLTVGAVAISRMALMNQVANQIATDPLPGTGSIGRIGNAIRQFRIYEYRHTLASNKSKWDQVETKARGELDTISRELHGYEKMITQTEDRENFDRLKTLWNAYLGTHEQMISLSRQDEDKKVTALLNGQSLQQFEPIQETLDKMLGWNIKNGERLAQEGAGTYSSARSFVIILLVAALVCGFVMAGLLTRVIVPPLAQITSVAERLALGEADQEVSYASRDEVGRLAESFRAMIAYQKQMAGVAEAMAAGDLTQNVEPKSPKDLLGSAFAAMIGNLRNLIRQVTDSSASVAASSSQLAASAEQSGQAATEIARTIQDVANAAGQSAMTSTEMAKGSEQQARAATEAANSMERLQATIGQVQESSHRQQGAIQQADTGMRQAARSVDEVARSTQQMASGAQQSATIAQAGGKAVEQTIASMGRIREQVQASAEKVQELGQKSQEIGAIVETIDQIAEQTNLLALNAAIEAARAGEHGKGFAVVADEVRKLAERSAAATKEIAGLIGSVRSGVEEAVRAMEQSNREVAAGVSQSEQAGTALAQILDSVHSVATEVEGVTAIAGEMAASVQGVLASVEAVRQAAEENERSVLEMAAEADQVSAAITTVASISEETAAGAQEMSAAAEEVSASAQNVTASVEEQTASIEEVGAAADELNHMAARLQDLVRQFRLEAEAMAAPPLRLRKVA